MDTQPTIGDGTAPYRTPSARLEGVVARLKNDRDCWFISANAESGPHAVPLSFLADGPRVLLATARDRPATRNVLNDPRVVLVLGGYGDAIRLAGEADATAFHELDDTLRARYVAKAGWDPVGSDSVGLVVTLAQVLCSRSPAEDRDRIVWEVGAPIRW